MMKIGKLIDDLMERKERLSQEDDEEDEESLEDVMDKELNEMEDVHTLSDEITKAFEEEGYKQNNYWEYDWEDDVMWGSFVDYELNVISVAFPEDDEFIEDKKSKSKKK